MKLTATVIVLLIISLFMLAIGAMLLLNKEKFEQIAESQKKKNYITINGSLNLIVGLMGIGLVIMYCLLPKYKDVIVIAFIILMLIASVVQKVLNKKYK
jgi:cell division protein FtsW (lipid II flippase)